MTALESGELITGIRFKLPRRSAYAKFKHPASGYAMAGVFAADLGTAGLRVTVTGAGGGVFRWTAAEQACQDSQTASCGDHSGGIANPWAAGVMWREESSIALGAEAETRKGEPPRRQVRQV